MSGGGSNSESEDAALKARLDKLSGAIKAEAVQADSDRQAAQARTSGAGTGKAMAAGFRVASELLAGVLVGAFIGWWVDRWLGSSPFALIGLTLVGTAGGFWNVYRFAARSTGGGADGRK